MGRSLISRVAATGLLLGNSLIQRGKSISGARIDPIGAGFTLKSTLREEFSLELSDLAASRMSPWIS